MTTNQLIEKIKEQAKENRFFKEELIKLINILIEDDAADVKGMNKVSNYSYDIDTSGIKELYDFDTPEEFLEFILESSFNGIVYNKKTKYKVIKRVYVDDEYYEIDAATEKCLNEVSKIAARFGMSRYNTFKFLTDKSYTINYIEFEDMTTKDNENLPYKFKDAKSDVIRKQLITYVYKNNALAYFYHTTHFKAFESTNTIEDKITKCLYRSEDVDVYLKQYPSLYRILKIQNIIE